MIDTNYNTETWQPLPNYDTFYSVSSLGNVRREKGHNGKCKAGRILKPRMANDGYLRLNISANKQRATFKVHHLVAMAFIGERPNGFVVNHIDGNKLNNRADNLEYITNPENIKHARKFGLMATGKKHYSVNSKRNSKNHCAKLTEADVKQIRLLSSQGVSSRIIANDFHISQSHTKNIVRRNCWRSI